MAWLAPAVLLLLLGGGARASFPGANGDLAVLKEVPLNCRDTGNPCANWVLRIVDWRTGSFELPLPCSVPECLHGTPAWSPDGERLALFYGDADPAGVWVMRPDASGLRPVVAKAFGPAWAPGGRRLVIGRRVSSRRFRPCCTRTELVVVSLDGKEERRVGFGSEPTWGTNGRIAFVRSLKRRGTGEIIDSELVTVDPDGGRLVRPGLRGTSPDWSPDGTRLVFERSALSSPKGIFVATADGRGEYRVAGAGAKSPVWSPDGTKIAYSRGNKTFVTRSGPTSRSRRPAVLCRGCQAIDWQPRPRERVR